MLSPPEEYHKFATSLYWITLLDKELNQEIQELRELAGAHREVAYSRPMRVGNELRYTLNQTKRVLRALLQLPRHLLRAFRPLAKQTRTLGGRSFNLLKLLFSVRRGAPAGASRGSRVLSADNLQIENTYDIDSDQIYTLLLSTECKEEGADKAILASIRFYDDAGELLGFATKGFNFSHREGHYQYVPANCEAHEIMVDPPAKSAQVAVNLKLWSAGLVVAVQEQSLRSAGSNSDRQLVEAKTAISNLGNLDKLAIVTEQHSRPIQHWTEAGYSVVLIADHFADEDDLPSESADAKPLLRLSNLTFRDCYQDLAEIVSSKRVFVVDRPSYYNVLHSSYFAYRGWDVSIEDDGIQGQSGLTNPKLKYLKNIATPRISAVKRSSRPTQSSGEVESSYEKEAV